jgi:hypothetical protein
MASNFMKINNGLSLGPQTADPANPINGDFYYNSSLGQFRKYTNGVWSNLGSGSGGSTNYILNPDCESGTTGWSTYSNTAQATPVTGSGGSPASTLTATSTTPLTGNQSFLLTKSANNRQGEGVSYDFTIDNAYQASVLQISFDYQPSSGYSSANSDLQVFIYDKTNAVLIPVTPQTLIGSSLTPSTHFKGTFQTAINSTSYRLIFHIATTSTTAWTFKFDNVSVASQITEYGFAGFDFKTFTGSGSWTTNTTYTASYARIGDSIKVRYGLTLSGAPNNVNLTLNLPPGLSIDTTKLVGTGSIPVGFGGAARSGVFTFQLQASYNSATSVYISNFVTQSGSNPVNVSGNQQVNGTTPFTFGSGDYFNVEFTVPIIGFSSNVIVSSDANTRVISFSGSQTSQAVTNSTNIAFTSNFDRAGAWNGTQYVVPVAGDYVVSGSYIASSLSTGQVFKNGAFVGYFATANSSGEVTGGSVLVTNCKIGDLLSIVNNGSTTASSGQIGIYLLTGPSQIASSESVNAKYQNAAGTALNTAFSPQTIPYATKIFDSHSAWNGTQYVVPIAGKYFVAVNMNTNAAAGGGSRLQININQNGVIQAAQDYYVSTIGAVGGGLSTLLNCLPGDLITISAAVDGGGSDSLTTNTAQNTVSIFRQGN